MNVHHIEAMLKETRTTIPEIEVPEGPGLYAIFLKSDATLSMELSTGSELIYIGKSSQLMLRTLGTHFESGGTGFSTLRRSLGALLKKPLQLTAIPRGTGNSKSDFSNYRFDDNGEDRLSKWMCDELEVGVCKIEDD